MLIVLIVIVTILLTAILVYFGTLYSLVEQISVSKNFRDYLRGLIDDFSDEDE